jgi:hypothetical protein
MALITGGDVLESALKGAAIGGVTGGIGEWATGAAEAASATSAASEASAATISGAGIGEEATAGLASGADTSAALSTVTAPTTTPGTGLLQNATQNTQNIPATTGVQTTQAAAPVASAPAQSSAAVELAKLNSANIKAQMLGQGVSEAGKALLAKDTNVADEQADAQIKLRNTNLAGSVSPTKAVFTAPSKVIFNWTDDSWKKLLPYSAKAQTPVLSTGGAA